MLQKNVVTEVPPNSSGILLKHIPGTQSSGGWRPVTDLKSLNAHIFAPHFRMFTTSSVLSTVQKGEDRYAGCVLSCTNTSRQQEVSQVCLQKQGLSVPGTSLWSEHIPSDLYSLVAHYDRLPPSSRDFG